MKVKIIGDVTVEEVIEIDDKFAKVVDWNNNDFTGTDEEADKAENLSEEAADIAEKHFRKKYKDKFHRHSVLVYDLDDNVIFEE